MQYALLCNRASKAKDGNESRLKADNTPFVLSVFRFSIQSLTASQQPFYSFSLLFAEGIGSPPKKKPLLPDGFVGQEGNV